MKIKIEVELTPEEARSFLGLPDVAPLNARLMEEMEARAKDMMAAMGPDAFVKLWMPLGAQGIGQMQDLITKAARATLDTAKGFSGGRKPRNEG